MYIRCFVVSSKMFLVYLLVILGFWRSLSRMVLGTLCSKVRSLLRMVVGTLCNKVRSLLRMVQETLCNKVRRSSRMVLGTLCNKIRSLLRRVLGTLCNKVHSKYMERNHNCSHTNRVQLNYPSRYPHLFFFPFVGVEWSIGSVQSCQAVLITNKSFLFSRWNICELIYAWKWLGFIFVVASWFYRCQNWSWGLNF